MTKACGIKLNSECLQMMFSHDGLLTLNEDVPF